VRVFTRLYRTEFHHTRNKKTIVTIIVRQKQPVEMTQGTQLNTRQQEHLGQSAVITPHGRKGALPINKTAPGSCNNKSKCKQLPCT